MRGVDGHSPIRLTQTVLLCLFILCIISNLVESATCEDCFTATLHDTALVDGETADPTEDTDQESSHPSFSESVDLLEHHASGYAVSRVVFSDPSAQYLGGRAISRPPPSASFFPGIRFCQEDRHSRS